MQSDTLPRSRSGRDPADLVEAGNLIRTGADAFDGTDTTVSASSGPERVPVAVIGAGQAGLSVSYHLKQHRIEHVVLDAAERIGDVWRNRWDSLKLFTPAKFDGLDGYPFPAHRDTFPTKDQMADYLEAYAAKFRLPVRVATPVVRLSRSGAGYRIETTQGTIEAGSVVVAAAGYQAPRIPDFATGLDDEIVQLHSRAYRNPSQIPDGPVLLVGAGNSGAEIAMDLAKTHEVWLAGRPVGHIPFDIAGFMGRKLLVRVVVRGMFHHLLTMRTPPGRKFRAKMQNRGMPLIRTRPGQLERAGVKRIGRITGLQGGLPVAEDGKRIDCRTVVWCTGYHPGFDWIDLPVLGSGGHPRHRFGKATDIDGVYFMGLHFQYAVSSTMVSGVGRDARRIAGWIAADQRVRSSASG
ncbi:NAD(P)-binding domain-containing protein [Rhodobacterales bacterium HKCCE3408]|nr:NAD(P)-binding domain-containing protein [Rhodobacterales bacterium HKCCE3408]